MLCDQLYDSVACITEPQVVETHLLDLYRVIWSFNSCLSEKPFFVALIIESYSNTCQCSEGTEDIKPLGEEN